jgi:hypothetical protein
VPLLVEGHRADFPEDHPAIPVEQVEGKQGVLPHAFAPAGGPASAPGPPSVRGRTIVEERSSTPPTRRLPAPRPADRLLNDASETLWKALTDIADAGDVGALGIGWATYGGEAYAFCAEDRLRRFVDASEPYLGDPSSAATDPRDPGFLNRATASLPATLRPGRHDPS